MKILLVEDEKAMSRTLKKELSNDYIVKVATTGKDGEYLANVNDYDLMILDVLLPDMDGISLCQRIRNNHIKTPILMLTGVSEVTKKIKALDSGADDYLIKPFHLVELRARIRALLRRQPEIINSRVLKIAD